MIRVVEPSVAPNYENDVRIPGAALLAVTPFPTSADFKAHRYWSRIHQYLYDSCAGICSYCASWIPRATNPVSDHHSSVDHFLAKTHFPELAYDWKNFRLSRRDVNENKDDDCDIVDPYAIEDGWFQLDFLSCRIKADPQRNPILRQRLTHTIRVLKLNEVPIIDERTLVVGNFAHDRITPADLQRLYPFVAKEIVRQNVDADLKNSLRTVHP